jgi:hypothetical protein
VSLTYDHYSVVKVRFCDEGIEVVVRTMPGVRFVKNALLFELNERKIGENNGSNGQHSFDWFCKTPKKQ